MEVHVTGARGPARVPGGMGGMEPGSGSVTPYRDETDEVIASAQRSHGLRSGRRPPRGRGLESRPRPATGRARTHPDRHATGWPHQLLRLLRAGSPPHPGEPSRSPPAEAEHATPADEGAQPASVGARSHLGSTSPEAPPVEGTLPLHEE